MSKTGGWAPFPHPDKAYAYTAAALKKQWQRLHLGDREALPSEESLAALGAANPKLDVGEARKTAAALLEAWRAYHAGEFEQAAQAGLALGPVGFVVANKATAIYANYLEPNDANKLALFESVAQRGEELIALAPKWPNAHYLHAYALGRYSQGISVVKALAQGLGGKIKDSLTRALKLEPDHADAHIALGAYHAEIIDKVGAMMGGLTYGASKDEAVKHYEAALRLNPDSAIARIEYANGIVMLFGKSKLERAGQLYEEAAACQPLDAMERLDVESAMSELEE